MKTLNFSFFCGLLTIEETADILNDSAAKENALQMTGAMVDTGARGLSRKTLDLLNNLAEAAPDLPICALLGGDQNLTLARQLQAPNILTGVFFPGDAPGVRDELTGLHASFGARANLLRKIHLITGNAAAAADARNIEDPYHFAELIAPNASHLFLANEESKAARSLRKYYDDARSSFG